MHTGSQEHFRASPERWHNSLGVVQRGPKIAMSNCTPRSIASSRVANLLFLCLGMSLQFACSSAPGSFPRVVQSIDNEFLAAVSACFDETRLVHRAGTLNWLEISVRDESRVTLIRDSFTPRIIDVRAEAIDRKLAQKKLKEMKAGETPSCEGLIRSSRLKVEASEKDFFNQLRGIEKPLELELVVVLHEAIVEFTYMEPGLSFEADWFRGDSSEIAIWAESTSNELLRMAKLGAAE